MLIESTRYLKERERREEGMDTEQPDLVPSPTGDDDSAMSNGKEDHSLDQKAIAYLLRYETMVQQQEAEHKATIEHIKPVFYIIMNEDRKLGYHDRYNDMKKSSMSFDMMMKQRISYEQLKRALFRIENSTSVGYMQTDRQLMMVLKTLTQQKTPSKDNEEESITWAEFVQCYKTVVSGMQTLQHVVDSPTQRTRIKDRTLSMISLYESPATKLLRNEGVPPPQDDIPYVSFEREAVHDITNESSIEDDIPSEKRKNRLFSLLIVLLGVAMFTARVLNYHHVIWQYAMPHRNQQVTYYKRGAIDESISRKSTFLDLSTASSSVIFMERKESFNSNIITPIATSNIEASPPSLEIEKTPLTLRRKSNLLMSRSTAVKTTGEDRRRFIQEKKIRRGAIISATAGAAAGMLLAPTIWKMILILGFPTATVGGLTALGGHILIRELKKTSETKAS